MIALLVCAAVLGAVVALEANGWLQRLELIAYDVMLARVVAGTPVEPSPRVAVIGVEEEDLRDEKVQFPVSDVEMTRLLRFLLPEPGRGARSVGVDIFRDIPAPDVDRDVPPLADQREDLIATLRDPRVFSVMEIAEDGTKIAVRPPKEVSDGQVGFADFVTDEDDVVRRAVLYTRLKPSNPGDPPGKLVNSLSFRVARRFLLPDIKPATEPAPGRAKDAIRLGRAVIRPFQRDDGAYVRGDDGGDQMILDFRGFGRIPVYRAGDVLEGKVPADAFDGRAVFIGMSAQSVKDLLQTPVANKTDGVMVHALTTDQLLRAALDGDQPLRVWTGRSEHAWAAAWTLAGGLLGFFVRRPWRLTGGLLALVGMVGLLVYRAFAGGLWLPALPPVIGCAAAAGLVAQFMTHRERAERTVLNDLFKRIVDEDVAETLWARRDELLDEGRLAASEVRATVLFTDLEGFTTITEAMDKSALMALLNDYIAVMSDTVGSRPDAFVNKYIGDAVMAVFGPPLERTAEQARADARHAVECALDMRARLAENRERWERACLEGIRAKRKAEGGDGDRLPEAHLRMRVGIQSGIVTAGSLGSRQRLEYTVIGDTVNTAARLEAFDKELMPPDLAAQGCRILIGQDTLKLLPPGEYLTREVGSIQLKGKAQMVTIHGVVGRASPAAQRAAGPVEVPVAAEAVPAE